VRSTPRSRSVDSTCTRAERTLRTGTDCALARARARARARAAQAAPARASTAGLSPRAGGTGIAARAPRSIPPARGPWCGRVRPLLQPDEPRGPAHDGERAEPGAACRRMQERPARGDSRRGPVSERRAALPERAETVAQSGETCREGPLAVAGGPGLPERAETAAGSGETCREGPLAVAKGPGGRVTGARRTGGNGGWVRRDVQKRPARDDPVIGSRETGWPALVERAETAALCAETCRRGPLAVAGGPGGRRSPDGRKRRLCAARRAEKARSR
jgi:hypothetical protein